MASKSVVIGAEAVQRRLRTVGQEAQRRALPRALNRTAQQAQTEAVRSVARKMSLQQKIVRKSFRIWRASAARPEAKLVARGWPIPLIFFRARQNRRGVAATVEGKRQTFRSAFIAKMPSARRDVFRRRSKARLPIDKLRGPSVPGTLAQREIMAALRKTIRERLSRNLAADLKYYLSRFRGQGKLNV